jgi:hypothetical protein
MGGQASVLEVKGLPWNERGGGVFEGAGRRERHLMCGGGA